MPNADKAAPKAEKNPNADKAAPAPAPSASLAERVTELEGDLKRLVDLLATIQGDPFTGLAREIVNKRQGA